MYAFGIILFSSNEKHRQKSLKCLDLLPRFLTPRFLPCFSFGPKSIMGDNNGSLIGREIHPLVK